MPFFQANAWSTLTGLQLKRFHVAAMRLCMAMALQPNDTPDDQVIEMVKLPVPEMLLGLLRLSLFRIVRSAPVQLLSILAVVAHHKASWLYAVQQDLKWVANGTGAFSSFKGKPFRHFAEAVRAGPRKVKASQVKAAKETDINKKAAWATTKAQQEVDHNFPCNSCNRALPTRQLRALHDFNVHYKRSFSMRAYVPETTCIACLQVFSSRFACIDHLTYKSARCRIVAQFVGDPMPPSELSKLDEKTALEVETSLRSGGTRWNAKAPSIRALGPLCSAAFTMGIDHKCRLKDGKKHDQEDLLSRFALLQ